MSASLSKAIYRLYIKFIRPVDPGLFISKYAGKATVCCLAALGVGMALNLTGQGLLWWLVGALCTVMFRTGSTFGRRKMYALVLLGMVCVAVPVAGVTGGAGYWGLGLVFLLGFTCFFVASMGVSASILGIGCLVVSLISFFDPAPLVPALMRSAWIAGGGLLSFLVNFYLWPFDPERVLLKSAKLAVEDMGTFFDGLSARIKNPRVSDENLAYLSAEAIAAIRRYRTFMESFNIDPLKGSAASGGAGLLYFGLIRLYESLVGLFGHIAFGDGRDDFEDLKAAFYEGSWDIGKAFDAFSEMKGGRYVRPDFDRLFSVVEGIQETLVDMKGYQQGEASQDHFMEAWGAVYELKNVVQGLQDMMSLAETRFRLKGDADGS